MGNVPYAPVLRVSRLAMKQKTGESEALPWSVISHLACMIHKYCRALACSFVRTESLVGRSYAWLRSPSLESASEQRPGAIIAAIHE